VDVANAAVLQERGRDEEAVVGRLLHEADHGGQAHGLRGEGEEARIVGPHRDLGCQVLEVVAGEAQLGEDDQPGPRGARL
jgi:hypothetical protein